MALSKRLRFEILRRDNHTCQYCGEKAPDVTLHVDHVIPSSLGGADQPGNLVAACKDCNAGKGSTQPDAPILEAINSRAATYALDMQDRSTRIRAVLEAQNEYIEEFETAWTAWQAGGENIPLPADHEVGIAKFCRMGVPIQLVEWAIKVAMTRDGLTGLHVEFRYMAGVVWRSLDDAGSSSDVDALNVSVYTELEFEERLIDERIAAYETGYNKAQEKMRGAPVGT